MRVVLFGTGMIYNKYIKYIDKLSIAFLIDNDVEKQGTLVNGCEVKSPASVVGGDYDYVIIMSKSIHDMLNQLLDYGISDKKIRTYKDIGDLYLIQMNVHCRNLLCTLDKWMYNHKHNKKIFVISHTMDRSGVPIALMNISVLLKRQGWNVLYGSYYEEDNLSEELIMNDIEYVENIELISSCAEFEDLVRMFDIIIVGTIVLADVVKKFIPYGVPIIFWMHESLEEYFNEHILPIGCEDLYYYGVGARVIEKFHDYYPDGKIEELRYFLPDIKYYDKLIHKKMIFGLIGWYSRRKGQDIFIKAFEMLSDDKRDDTEVFMVCPGCEVAEDVLKDEINSISQVHVLGELTQNEIKEFYKSIDVLVCPSRDDPMPIVVTEAMQNRIPCIVSNQVGQSEYMRNNYGGYVFESENTEKLAKLLVYCIDNKETVLKKGEEAYHIYCDKFSEKVAEKSVSRIMDMVLKNNE